MDLDEWKKNAICCQDGFSDWLEDRIWDEFKTEEKRYMYLKIATALFGKPVTDNEYFGYSKKQRDLAERIIDTIVKYSVYKDKIHMAVIFVCIYHDKQLLTTPVIRVRTTEGAEDISDNAFIDHIGRFYKNWQTYLKTNQLYRSWLCVPINGFYSSERDYNFINQENYGSLLMKLENLASTTNIISSVTMLTGAVMTIIPPLTAPGVVVLGTSTGIGAPGMIFGLYRGVQSLVDRAVHKQSVALKNNEARQSWLLLSGSILSLSAFGCSRFIAGWARAGKAIPGTMNLLFSGLQLTSVGINGVIVFNSMYELCKEKRKPSSLELLHITTSILLFTHSLLSVKTVNKIVTEAQDNTILSLFKNGQHNANVALKNEKKVCNTNEQKFIKSLTKIDTFSSLLEVSMETAKNSSVSLSKSFCTLSKSIKSEIMSLLEKLKKRQITEKEFINEVPEEVKNIVKDNRKTNKEMLGGSNSILKTIPIGKIIEKLNSIDKACIEKIVETFNADLLPIRKILENFKFETSIHFYQVVKRFVDYIENEHFKRRLKEPSPIRSKGISVPQHYRLEVEKEISEENSSKTRLENDLKELYESCQNEPFECEGFIQELNILSFEQCCSIVNDMVEFEISTKQWYQKDFVLECKFESEYNNIESISFVSVDSSSVLVSYDAKQQYRLYTV